MLLSASVVISGLLFQQPLLPAKPALTGDSINIVSVLPMSNYQTIKSPLNIQFIYSSYLLIHGCICIFAKMRQVMTCTTPPRGACVDIDATSRLIHARLLVAAGTTTTACRNFEELLRDCLRRYGFKLHLPNHTTSSARKRSSSFMLD